MTKCIHHINGVNNNELKNIAVVDMKENKSNLFTQNEFVEVLPQEPPLDSGVTIASSGWGDPKEYYLFIGETPDEKFLRELNMLHFDRIEFINTVGLYLKGLLFSSFSGVEKRVNRTECRKILENIGDKQFILTTNYVPVSVCHIEGKEIVEE